MITDPAADDSRGGSVLVRVATFFLMGALAYVLSLGPVVWYAKELPDEQLVGFQRIYAPIGWLMENTPLGPPLVAYVRWWGNLGREK